MSADDGSTTTLVNSTALSIDSTGVLFFDASAVNAWSCATEPGATGGGGGGGTVSGDCTDYQTLLDSLAGARKELTHRVVESQKECLKGHFKQARHKLDEFVKEAGKAKYDQAQAGVWITMALALRDSLPVPPPK